MQRFPEVGKSAQAASRLFSIKSQAVPTPCESEMLWQSSDDLMAYVAPAQAADVTVGSALAHLDIRTGKSSTISSHKNGFNLPKKAKRGCGQRLSSHSAARGFWFIDRHAGEHGPVKVWRASLKPKNLQKARIARARRNCAGGDSFDIIEHAICVEYSVSLTRVENVISEGMSEVRQGEGVGILPGSAMAAAVAATLLQYWPLSCKHRDSKRYWKVPGTMSTDISRSKDPSKVSLPHADWTISW
jgi:hypothetical protein